ncbi:MAG TPA: glycogen/starch synthase, partial [bacterium]
MKICFAVSECVPYVKTGGLADVAGALPKALQQLGCEVKVFLPLYSSIDTVDHDLILAAELADIPVKIGDKMVTFNTWYGHLPNSEVEVYLLDCPLYYDRDRPYTSDSDEDERFVLLQQGILQILQRYHWAPDVMHCNDWQTALLPVYLKINYKWDSLFANTATLLSIHNIGYQGRFSRDAVYRAGLSLNDYYPGGPLE